MELEDFLKDNGWALLNSNQGIKHITYEKSMRIVNIVGKYAVLKDITRVAFAGTVDEVFGYIKASSVYSTL